MTPQHVDESRLGSGHRLFYVDNEDRVHHVSQADWQAVTSTREQGGRPVAKLKGSRACATSSCSTEPTTGSPTTSKHVSTRIMPLNGRGGLDEKGFMQQMADGMRMVNIAYADIGAPKIEGSKVLDAKK